MTQIYSTYQNQKTVVSLNWGFCVFKFQRSELQCVYRISPSNHIFSHYCRMLSSVEESTNNHAGRTQTNICQIRTATTNHQSIKAKKVELRPCSFRGSILKYQSQPTSINFNPFQPISTILTKFNLLHKKNSTHFNLLQPTSTYFNLPQPTSPFYPPQFTYEKNRP